MPPGGGNRAAGLTGGDEGSGDISGGGPSADDLRGGECHLSGRVCLFGGGNSHEGNVHVGGKPVCDDSWDLVDAGVVCRQLGFHGASRATKESRYGTVSANFAMDNVGCSGTELKLLDCPHSKQDDCGASEGAGVACDLRSLDEIEAERAILLTCFEEGVSYYYGEYLDFDAAESSIACQKHCIAHTDCSHFTYYPASNRCYRKQGGAKRSIDGAISGPRNCSDPNGGNAKNTNNTATAGQTTPGRGAAAEQRPHNCSSPGVVCLVGGSKPSEGNVFVGNKPVCDDDWTLVNANVVCRQLGFSGALVMTKESRFGPVPDVFAMDQVSCEGSEERLIDCRHSPIDDCGAGEGAGAVCGNLSPEEEQAVQASCFRKGVSYSPGSWIDYEVVPSPLDCQTHCRSHAECRFFTFYRDTNKCYRKTTSEPTLRMEAVSGPRDCQLETTSTLPGPGGTGVTSHRPLLPSVDCRIPGVVCLKGGNTPEEGNVFVGDRPVCDDSWDTRDGRVVCRELGYVDVIRTYGESQFGKVPANFAMDNVACTGWAGPYFKFVFTN